MKYSLLPGGQYDEIPDVLPSRQERGDALYVLSEGFAHRLLKVKPFRLKMQTDSLMAPAAPVISRGQGVPLIFLRTAII
ncbi:MAG: hypothetical protein IJK51_09025 [Bacteroidaceae bacterium]|nr:hypothetical protein [Bacteroidaceae bacterium]